MSDLDDFIQQHFGVPYKPMEENITIRDERGIVANVDFGNRKLQMVYEEDPESKYDGVEEVIGIGWLAVRQDQRHHGVARMLLDNVLYLNRHTYYLVAFTAVPTFFEKCGYRRAHLEGGRDTAMIHGNRGIEWAESTATVIGEPW